MDDLITECAPTNIVKLRSAPPWMDRKTEKLLEMQHKTYNKMKRTGLQVYAREYEKLRKENKKVVKKRKARYLSDKLFQPLHEGKTRLFYKFSRENRSNDGGIVPKLKQGNTVAKTTTEKANLLNKQF